MSHPYSTRGLQDRLDRYASLLEDFEALRYRLDLKQVDLARMLNVTQQTVNAAVHLDDSIRLIEQGIEVMGKIGGTETPPFKLVTIEAYNIDDDSETLVIQGKLRNNGSLTLSDGLYGYVQDWVPEDDNDEAGEGILQLMTFPFMVLSKPNSPHGYINYGGEYLDEDYVEGLDGLKLKSRDPLVRVTKHGAYKYHVRTLTTLI